MAWTAPKTWVAGATLTASEMNTYLSDNDSALRAGGLALGSQAAGDVLYASSATQLARVGIGTAGQVLRVNSGATAPEWYSLPTQYGQLYGNTQTTVTISSSGVYVKITALNVAGESSGVTLDPTTDNDITISTAGIYLIGYSCAIAEPTAGGGQKVIDVAAHVDGSEVAASRMYVDSRGAAFHASAVAIANLSNGTEVIDLRARNNTDTSNLRVEDCNLWVRRIG